MISLVMATYNGSKYILQQLESIKCQTRTIEEVVIIDDNSTDNTFEIISKYITTNNLNWRFKKNKTNSGWKKNFYELIKNTNGDIVFLCDQDDIWDKNKVEYMASVLEKNENVKLLQSNYELYFEEKPKKFGLKVRLFMDNFSHKKAKNTLQIKKRNISRDLLHQEPGCVMAFKRDLFNDFECYWNTEYGHDLQLTMFALLRDSYYIIDYSSIKWRRHLNNASTPVAFISDKRKNELLENQYLYDLIKKILKEKKISVNKKFNKYLIKNEKINNIRKKVVIEKKKLNWFRYFRYYRFFVRKRDILSDLKYIK